MKVQILTTILAVLIVSVYTINPITAQNVAVTDDDTYTADPSAMLDVKSTTKGFLVPRLTTVQRDAISSPATGLMVFDTDLNRFYYFEGTFWIGIFSGAESDPVFASSSAAGIGSPDITNWNTAYGWGDHSLAGYLTSFSETDPIFAAHAANGITSTNITDWNTAYGWGNHADEGYLTSFSETDPIFGAHAANGITSTNITNWNSAYGWGNHADAGYLTSYTETGTVASVGLSLPSEFTVTGSPVTTSGTLTGAWASKSANLVFASPNGSAGIPTFRSLVSNDIPDLSASKITSGILPIARGGTNSGTALNNNRIIVSSGGALCEAAALTDGKLLIGSTGAAPVAANLTQGTGITITNSAGGITVAAASGTDTDGADDFIQNGNSFGTTAFLGTNDAQSLAIETNASERLRITPTGLVGIGTNSPQNRLVVKGDAAAGMDEAIFAVVSPDGDTLFAVYPEGTRVYVNDDPAKASGNRAGFAVGGFSLSKGLTNEYLRVTPDSVRIYIEESDPAKAGANKAGFAVGGFSLSKPAPTEYFNIQGTNSAEVYNPSVSRILWYPRKEAFLTGRVLVESPDSVGTNSMATGYESKAIGDYSQALGYRARAYADNSTAIGNYADARGASSYAMGDYAKAYGAPSYAFGAGAYAGGLQSFAFGSVGIDSAGTSTGNTRAVGNYSYAFGMGAVATHQGAFAFGTQTLAAEKYALAMGYKTEASNWYAVATGYKTKATGGYAFASGASSVASGWYSTAMGTGTASGGSSTAIGAAVVASGSWSTALGSFTLASSNNATAMGFATEATGEISTAMGFNTKAQGDRSVAMGSGSVATGNYSIAMGYDATTTAAAQYGVAMGSSTTASGMISTAMGASTTASNTCATAMGNNTIASGHSSTAMGMQTQATGNYSTAMGYTSRATNTYATAMGYNTLASGSNATTMGIQTEAAGYGSFAIGRGIKVSGMYSAGIAIADMTGTEVVDPNTLAIMGGEVGIGIVSPTCALDVNGKSKTTNFQMTNGASSGYILQSDASGNASWVSNGDNSSSNEIQNLSQVLAQGNSAGSYSINLNTNGITNVNNASFRATDGDMGNLTYTVDDRWELSNGGFYIMNTCPTTWIYSDNIYLGNADSDIIHTRDNQFRTRYIRAYSANGINFQTDDGLDRLFLADNGNFGVGTTSPAEKLHINGSLRGNQSGAVRISTGYGYVDIGPENTGWSHFVTDRPSFYFSSPIYIDGGRLSSYSTNHLYLQTDGTTRLFINNTSGNVGIGTTSPAYTFDVSGTARISSTADPGLILGSGTSSYLQFGDSNVKMYRAANDRITIRVESTDNAAQFASYGLYLPQAVGTALYVTGGARINYNDSGDEVFITDADGYIGNGVTTPAAPLHIANTAWLPWGGWNNMIQLENNSHAGITYKDGDDNNGILMGFHGVDDAIYFGWISNWSSGTGNYMMKLSSNGNLHAYGNITATGTCCSSDLCWKRNIQPIDNALGKVLKMRGVTFEWKRDDESGQNFREGKNIGVIAQEVEKVFPELVETSDEGKKYVYYQNITAVLIEAMKEQQKQIEQLQEKVETGDKVLLEKSQEIDELKEEISKVKELLQSSSKK